MNIAKIPKKAKGEFREICVVRSHEKEPFVKDLLYLNELCLKLCNDCVHGFMPYRSPITNALVHRGYNFTLNLDLSDFFDTVTKEMVAPYLYEEILNRVFINGRAYQGLPTSPAVANLAAIKLDRDILDIIRQINDKIVYTRYADDLTISFNEYLNYQELKNKIIQAVENNGFKINSRKIHLQTAKFGRRVITGISVGEKDIKPTRKNKRDLKGLRNKIDKLKEDSFICVSDANDVQISILEQKICGLTRWLELRHPRHPISHVKEVLANIFAIKKGRIIINNYKTHIISSYNSIIKEIQLISAANDVRNFIRKHLDMSKRVTYWQTGNHFEETNFKTIRKEHILQANWITKKIKSEKIS